VLNLSIDYSEIEVRFATTMGITTRRTQCLLDWDTRTLLYWGPAPLIQCVPPQTIWQHPGLVVVCGFRYNTHTHALDPRIRRWIDTVIDQTEKDMSGPARQDWVTSLFSRSSLTFSRGAPECAPKGS
jgi:hypothetical protein